jgi:hypothetical protein
MFLLCRDCRHRHQVANPLNLRSELRDWKAKHKGHRTALSLRTSPRQRDLVGKLPRWLENANVKSAFGAKTSITMTSLNSLANGSGAQSAAVDNTSNLYLDFRIRIQIPGAASQTGLVDFYCASALGDTTYLDGASGSDSSFTAGNRLNAHYLGSIQTATSGTQIGEVTIAQAFGGVCPDKFALVAINNAGAALTASSNVVEYEGVYATVI